MHDWKIPGRQKKTTKRDDRIIVRKSKSDRFKTAPETKAEMQIEHGVNASTSIIQRRLREAGLNGRKPRSTPHLTARHKKARLEFARVRARIGQLNSQVPSCFLVMSQGLSP